MARLRILYLVHDLSDPSVARRVRMLQSGGAELTVIGFHRSEEQLLRVASCEAVDLGRTYNARFAQRIGAVVRVIAAIAQHRHVFARHDLLIARNLEMLAIAVRGRKAGGHLTPIVYESLDIHRLLLRSDLAGRCLRRLEGWLSRRACLLITSSPAFVRHYFQPLSHVRLPHEIVENKVFWPEAPSHSYPPRAPGPPWKIGWFGAIRCRRSLELLSQLVAALPGEVEVVIRGRVSHDRFTDFEGTIAALPGLHFEGAYRYPDDLEAIYRDVHFSWCMDWFEAGENSAWLLPNRLYEGGLFATVPLALESVETGRLLRSLGIGVLLPDAPYHALHAFFRSLTAKRYATLEAAVASAPRAHFVHDEAACLALVARLAALTPEHEDHTTYGDEPAA